MATRVLALGPGNCRYEFTEYENQDGFLAPGEFEGDPEKDHAARSLQSFNEVMRSWKWTIRGLSALTYCVLSMSVAVVAIGLYLLIWPLLIVGALAFVIGNIICCRIRWMAASKLIESLQERAREINESSRSNIRFQVRHQQQNVLFGWMRVRLRMVDLNAMRTTEIRVLGRASHIVPMENLQANAERSKLLALCGDQHTNVSSQSQRGSTLDPPTASSNNSVESSPSASDVDGPGMEEDDFVNSTADLSVSNVDPEDTSSRCSVASTESVLMYQNMIMGCDLKKTDLRLCSSEFPC